MKIVIIGGTGTIGKKVTEFFSREHEVLTVGKNSGDHRVAIEDESSIRSLFEKTGKFDALISIAGEAKWALFSEMKEADFYIGIKSKLMGQVNLVRYGIPYLNRPGSITLTTGILADRPVPLTTSAAMVNGGIHSFVKALALELPKDVRVNAVSSGLVADSYEKYREFFPGQEPIPMELVVQAYEKSVIGEGSGQIYTLYP